MSCGCENKKYSKDYERIKALAEKMSKLDKKAYFVYKKGDKYDFEPVYPVSDNMLEAVEFILPV